MAQIQKDIFLDVNSNYDFDGKELVSNLKAINNSIFNILGTPIGSRAFRPTYGSNLHRYIYEPMDDITAVKIKSSVMASLAQWEPRIQVDFHACTVTPINTGGFTVYIAYSVPNISVSSSTSLSFTG